MIPVAKRNSEKKEHKGQKTRSRYNNRSSQIGHPAEIFLPWDKEGILLNDIVISRGKNDDISWTVLGGKINRNWGA